MQLPNPICYIQLESKHMHIKECSMELYVFLPSCSKSISRPFLRRTFDSQNSALFSWGEGGGPCSIPPRQWPIANARDRSRSSNQTHVFSSSCCCFLRNVFSSLISAKEIFTERNLYYPFMKVYTGHITLISHTGRSQFHWPMQGFWAWIPSSCSSRSPVSGSNPVKLFSGSNKANKWLRKGWTVPSGSNSREYIIWHSILPATELYNTTVTREREVSEWQKLQKETIH